MTALLAHLTRVDSACVAAAELRRSLLSTVPLADGSKANTCATSQVTASSCADEHRRTQAASANAAAASEHRSPRNTVSTWGTSRASTRGSCKVMSPRTTADGSPGSHTQRRRARRCHSHNEVGSIRAGRTRPVTARSMSGYDATTRRLARASGVTEKHVPSGRTSLVVTTAKTALIGRSYAEAVT